MYHCHSVSACLHELFYVSVAFSFMVHESLSFSRYTHNCFSEGIRVTAVFHYHVSLPFLGYMLLFLFVCTRIIVLLYVHVALPSLVYMLHCPVGAREIHVVMFFRRCTLGTCRTVLQ